MFATLMVTFREGVEAFLIVAVTLLYLRQTQRDHLIGALRWGVATAVLLSVGLGIVLARVGALQPLYEGWLSLVAFVLVLSCTVHMLRRGKHIANEIRQKIASTDRHGQTGAKWAIFLFVTLMIGREGVETATMLASLSGSSDMTELFVGGILGIVLASLLALAWSRYGRLINLARFFQVTAIFMVLFSTQLLIYAFHEFTEAGVVPGLDNAIWHILSEPYSAHGIYGAWLSYGMVGVPMMFLLLTWLRQRQTGHMQSV